MGLRHGFTLIELLIVVAIIAILAAIAVPNFLEAQVRAKVARAKGDLRSIATAFQSYAIDNNGPPPDHRHPMYGVQGARAREAWSKLTTPVSYIAAVPTDPFPQGPRIHTEYWYIHEAYHWADAPGPEGLYTTCRGNGFSWCVWTEGPSDNRGLKAAYPFGAFSGVASGYCPDVSAAVGSVYDATNGTRSLGRVMMTNKGVVDGTVVSTPWTP